MPSLETLLGSRPFLAWRSQNQLSSGAKRKIIAGLKAWNHDEGIVNSPMKFQLVRSSAQSWSVLPCCS